MTDWHKFPRISVALEPHILSVIDFEQGVVLINSRAAPGANIVCLRQ